MKKNKKLTYSIALSSLAVFPISASFDHLYFQAAIGYYFNFEDKLDENDHALSAKIGYHLDDYLATYFKCSHFDSSAAQGFGLEYKKPINNNYQLIHSVGANSTKFQSHVDPEKYDLLPELGFGLRYINSQRYSIDIFSSMITKNDFSGFSRIGLGLGINFGSGASFGYQIQPDHIVEMQNQDIDYSDHTNEALSKNQKSIEIIKPSTTTELIHNQSKNKWDNIAVFSHNSIVPQLDEEVIELIKDKKYSSIILYGHTDNQGSQQYNLKLGYQRADSVKQALIKYGFEPSRIKVKSYGESGSIVTNNSESNRAKNRRVSVELKLDPENNVLPKAINQNGNEPSQSTLTLAISTDKTDIIFKQNQWDSVAVFPKNSVNAKIQPEILKALLKEKYEKITLYGHTDDRGSSKYNINLGYIRAEIIREQLIKSGIDSNRIKVRSKGSEEPLQSNDTEQGRALNRRVSIILTE